MNSIYKAIIIDDERLARVKLRRLLESHTNIKLVGEADSVANGIELIKQENPDLIFLDIQMPNETGFDLLEQTNVESKIIFVTAFDEYAIRAFEVNAIDYLLKPINPNRLAEAIDRLSNLKQTESSLKTLEYDDYFFVNTKEESKFVKLNSIKCIVAADIYTEILTDKNEKFLISKPMHEWETQLPEKNFIRIHRSTIINLEHVVKVEKWFNYTYQVYLEHINEPFTISRRYATKIKGKFGLTE